MNARYDLLVYMALGGLLLTVIAGAWVLVHTPEADADARRIRFAAATFTGLLLLLVFVAALYYAQPEGAGKDIFDRSVAAITALAGGIVGHVFGHRRTSTKPERG